MLSAVFGWRKGSSTWRKASKCKKLIEQARCSLKNMKNRRASIIRQSRQDMAQLLKNGQDQRAFARVQQLYKDQGILSAYDQLDQFCKHVYIHIPIISRHRILPSEVSEAVSSLIFAAARCGEVPELHILRNLFRERYGCKFTTANVELLPWNLVNDQIIEKLSIKSIPDDLKVRLMEEIAKDYSLHLGPQDIEDRFQLQRQKVYNHDPYEGSASSGSTMKKKKNKNTSGRRLKRRCVYPSIMVSKKDLEYAMYYGESRTDGNSVSSGSYYERSTEGKISVEESLGSSSSTSSDKKSDSSSSLSYVHPKLPEYDDFVAKFMALKMEYFGRNQY